MDNLTLDAEVKDQIATISSSARPAGLGTARRQRRRRSQSIPVIEKFHLEGPQDRRCRGCLRPGRRRRPARSTRSMSTSSGRPSCRTGAPLDWLAAAHREARRRSTDHRDQRSDLEPLALRQRRRTTAKCGADQRAPRTPTTRSSAPRREGARRCLSSRPAARRDLGGQLAGDDHRRARGGAGQDRDLTARHLGGTLAIDDMPLTMIDQFLVPPLRRRRTRRPVLRDAAPPRHRRCAAGRRHAVADPQLDQERVRRR